MRKSGVPSVYEAPERGEHLGNTPRNRCAQNERIPGCGAAAAAQYLVPLREASLGRRHARFGDRHCPARVFDASARDRAFLQQPLRAREVCLRAIECRLCFRHGGFERRSVLAAARETGLEPAERLSCRNSIADRWQLL